MVIPATAEQPRPLAGLRVVEDQRAHAAATGRFLAELGADVVLLLDDDSSASLAESATATFEAEHASKRIIKLDLSDESARRHVSALLDGADIWLTPLEPHGPRVPDLDPDHVRTRAPHLVIGIFSPFGAAGPYADWSATDWIHLALGGQLRRSGTADSPPLMPPEEILTEAAGIHAAWTVLVAYWNRLRNGRGDVLDISRHEALAQIVDPALGSIGTAAAARSGSGDPDGRGSDILYPIFPCADGHVRFAVLAPKQWHSLRAWLGEPEEFMDPSFDQLGERYAVADRLYPLIGELVQDKPTTEIVTEAQQRGIPVAPVLTLNQAFDSEHFAARRLFQDAMLSDGRHGRVPAGHLLIDGQRLGRRWSASKGSVPAGETEYPRAEWVAPALGRASSRCSQGDQPLSGVRVLDLGVIVMGGETGRMFGDQGAEVIKVENRRFPDGARLSGLNPRFAAGQRNKRSFGVDLRSDRGREIFEQLVARSDVVLTNFRPGTLDALGIGADRLRELNPKLILTTSSAMGDSGPWRDWMGYGPLVRSVSGLTALWKKEGASTGFGDATTIFPDHLVARIVAAGVLAALIQRERDGTGSHLESSQAESTMIALAPRFLQESLKPGTGSLRSWTQTDAPWGVYPCRGEDEWCAITVRHDADWQGLVRALGHPGWASDTAFDCAERRLEEAGAIDVHLRTWTSTRTASEVTSILQAQRVPAAPVQRGRDQVDDPHLTARRFFRTFHQPGLPDEVTAEAHLCPSLRLPDPPISPAPFYGEHTRVVARELLGLNDREIDELVAADVLDEMSDADAALLGAPTPTT